MVINRKMPYSWTVRTGGELRLPLIHLFLGELFNTTNKNAQILE